MTPAQAQVADRAEYEAAAQAYLQSLTLENFMEAETQGYQRSITLASLALVQHYRPDVHFYNEMLVQYRLRKGAPIRQVVPDNMVVVHSGELTVAGSFNVSMQPARPFWTLEYVSRRNKRKDYEHNFRKYEKELKVPYYLLFYPDDQELSLYRRHRARYVSVKPGGEGRLAIAPLELEAALLNGWVRFWFRGTLLPLPAQLQQQVDDLLAQNAEKDREIQRLRAELDRLRQA